MLQEFLRAGLLDIGSDDRQLEVMRKAAGDVGKGLEKERVRIVPFVIATLDPNITPDDPVVKKVEGAIEKHWATYRNAFRDTPRQIVRAVALEALQGVAKDIHLAAAIRLTGDSFLPYSNFGSERPLIEQFLQGMRDQAEAKAVEEWSLSSETSPKISTPNSAKAFKPNVAPTPVKYVPVALEALTNHLTAAAGNSSATGAQLVDVNDYTPDQSPPHWANHFAPRAAQGIKEVIDKAQAGTTTLTATAFGELTTQINEQLTELAQATQRAIESAQSAARGIGQQSAAHQLRTNLLWWRQALYSPLLQRGYRELLCQEGPSFVAAAMAFDLSQQLPALCPLSVEYWLREAVNAVIETGPEEKPTLELSLQSIFTAASWPKLREVSEIKPSSFEGRTSLLRFLTSVAGQSQLRETIFTKTGLAASLEVAPPDLAVQLWRDLMAERLLANRLSPIAVNA